MSSNMLTPEVLWAQRSNKVDPEKNYIHLTINVPDVPKENLKLDIQPTQINFTGTCSTHEKRTYHLELPLHGEIDPAASSISHNQHSIRLKLQKKELKEEYWPRLQKGTEKLHFLKTDFDKWVDEDEQDEAPEDDFSQFGGMGGMPGMGGGSDFDGIDFSQLGNQGAAPADDDDDDDDDDMPALEGEEEAKEPAKVESKEEKKPETKA